MNILLTSVGRRGYLVKYFKEIIGEDGYVHVANNIGLTPAFQYSDYNVITPLIYDKEYIPFLKEYCKKNKIDLIISLFDIDLPILAQNKNEFKKIGVNVIVSEKDVINICNDKWNTYKFLSNNYINTPKTFLYVKDALESIKNNEISYPLIIKPRWGMGSIGVYEADNEKELDVLFNKAKKKIFDSYLKYESQKNINDCIIIQEKLIGQEYGLDIINNLDGNYQNTIIKKKYAMRSGETDCAEIVENQNIKKLGKSISEKLKHVANLDVDAFEINNKIYILEMNARFGGGYPFSHIAGVNLPMAIIRWAKGLEVDKEILVARIGTLGHKDIRIVEL